MAAKPRFRFPLFPVLARPRGTRPAAIIAIATAIGFLTLASPSLAATGSVYVDANSNVGAGHDFFSGTTPVGEGNVGLGYHVMPALTSGGLNVAIGTDALNSIATGSSNVATGASALSSTTSGIYNVASGDGALLNSTGSYNVAVGGSALIFHTSGRDNVGLGYQALAHNATGRGDVALGSQAGTNLATGSDDLYVANAGRANESGTIRIGASKQTRAFLAGVGGTSIPGPAQPVLVNAAGQLGTASSSSASLEGAKPLSAAAGRRLIAENKRQDREIRRLREQVRSGG